MKAEALPQGWSPLWAELWALAQALQHAKGKGVNFYTEARYAFATLRIHGAVYKERELLTVGGKEIKKQKEIVQLLKQSGSLPKWQSSTVKAISEELIQSAMGIGWRPGSQGGSNPSEPHSGP